MHHRLALVEYVSMLPKASLVRNIELPHRLKFHFGNEPNHDKAVVNGKCRGLSFIRESKFSG